MPERRLLTDFSTPSQVGPFTSSPSCFCLVSVSSWTALNRLHRRSRSKLPEWKRGPSAIKRAAAQKRPAISFQQREQNEQAFIALRSVINRDRGGRRRS